MDEGCAPTPAEARLILAMFELYRQQEYQDNTDRIEVECSFRLGKCCYGMGRPSWKRGN